MRERLNDLQRLRDEIRVRIHLLGMDAHDAWTDLERRFVQLERDLAHGAVGLEIAAILDHVGDGYHQLARRLRGRA